MAKSAAQMSDSWTKGMQAPQTRQNYIDGINNTTVNPMAAAATPEAMNLYLTKVQQSVSSGKRQRKLMAANPATWKTNATTVGANSLTTGATKAKTKVDAHFQKWQPIYQQAAAAAAAIPHDGSMGSALQRVQAAMQVMMQASQNG